VTTSSAQHSMEEGGVEAAEVGPSSSSGEVCLGGGG
jgi:hypothetical protein